MTTSASKKVVFLESIEGIETLFTRGLRTGASQAGWQPILRFLRNRNEESLPTSEIADTLKRDKPDLICFIMDAPIPWENLWEENSLQQIPKISLWFDDFLRSPHTLEFPKRWEHWQKQCHTQALIWDGYWRKEWQKMTNAVALPIHLAADETQFDPQAKPLYPELKDRAVMLGTIPALASLQKESSALPSPVQKLLQDCIDALEKDSWPISPYQRAEQIIQQSPEKIRAFLQQWLKIPVQQALFHHQLWRWGKRIARLRGLKAIAQAVPVAVLSGHRTEVFAQKEEIQAALSRQAKFDFYNTTDVSPQKWSSLFRSGKFQIQITDPQSIEGGIPFRVFECAACAAPLLSDERKELTEIFPNLPSAKTENDLAQKASEMMTQDLQPLAQEIHKNFLAHHTWKTRWQQVVQ